MSFWSFFRKKSVSSAPPRASEPSLPPITTSNAPRRPSTRPPPAPFARPEAPELEILRRVGTSEAPDDAVAVSAFDAIRAHPDEARAIDLLLRRAAERPIPEPLAIAAAAALVDRGEPRAALDLLAFASSEGALVLAADVRAEQGDVAGALALVERVLLRDLDHPGARERHRRFRIALGLDDTRPRDPAGTTVVTREPDAPFTLLREVARGGAGAVYEAEDRELHRHVALKVYHRPDRDRAQLLHEARVAAALAGAGIVRVLDADPDHGWIALEWAPLGSLRDHLRAKDIATLLPIERWALPLASALARVHADGWVHHDVKPANVLLHAPDRPVLADFGTARRAGEPSPHGSLGYVSPERLAGRASDPRDDVFGFGRILDDVLDALAAGDPSLVTRFRPLAAACVGPDDARPSDARALLTRLRVEAS